MAVEEGLGGKAPACRALGLSRSCFYVESRVCGENRRLRQEIIELSPGHPRYGYRRVTAMLRKAGWTVNPKRVQRVRRAEGLRVSRKLRKMRRSGAGTSQRQRASHPNHVWSWDFVEDRTENGGRFRMLTILDEYTREWLHFHLDHSIRAEEVVRELGKAMAV